METTNEILDSASHDCPLAAQTYSSAVTKGTHAPTSPTRLGKGHVTRLGGHRAGAARAPPALPFSLVGTAHLPLRVGQGSDSPQRPAVVTGLF